jgi:3-phosphoshikimate 1-carboxyvinyltransferase
MRERPQAALFFALRELGYRIDSEKDRLPALVHGAGPKPGARCRVSLEQSSQFASALLLSGKKGGWRIEMTAGTAGREQTIATVDTRDLGHFAGQNSKVEEELPYVAMTSALQSTFPGGGGTFLVEPDASSGSYFWAVNEVCRKSGGDVKGVRVKRWPESGWQIDAKFPASLPLPTALSRRRELGDSIMTAIVIAPFAERATHFTELGRLRLQECERVAALRTELTKCGVQVLEHGDTLTVFPAGQTIHGASIETYNDHRMAMCFAILGLKVPGIKIKNPACVKKTFPNFFQKLAEAPPRGLGVKILDEAGRKLSHADLFAE